MRVFLVKLDDELVDDWDDIRAPSFEEAAIKYAQAMDSEHNFNDSAVILVKRKKLEELDPLLDGPFKYEVEHKWVAQEVGQLP